MRRFLLAALAAASLCTSASAAGKPKTLEELFAPLSQGACVTIDALRTVGVTTQLTPEQFQWHCHIRQEEAPSPRLADLPSH